MTKLYEQLVEKAAACNLPADASHLERLKAYWELYVFLTKTKKFDLVLSVNYALHDHEPELTEADKEVMRQEGYSFPEDWDEPKTFAKDL